MAQSGLDWVSGPLVQGQGLKLLFEAWALVRDPQLAPITAGDPSWFQWPSSTPSQCPKPLFEAWALDRDPQLAPIACRGPQLALITCEGPLLALIFPSDLRLQYPSSNNCSPRLQPSWLGEQQPHEQLTPIKEQQRCAASPCLRSSSPRSHHGCKQCPPEELLATEEKPLPRLPKEQPLPKKPLQPKEQLLHNTTPRSFEFNSALPQLPTIQPWVWAPDKSCSPGDSIQNSESLMGDTCCDRDMIFEDLAIAFSQEEWGLLDEDQRLCTVSHNMGSANFPHYLLKCPMAANAKLCGEP
ncbi:hypothetical protein QTO34_006340 [Cnephaeus nilssonii]|uniref:KRAB domain-containing protein n=1 Tax=Cnephaeus nilssonii TaxID=3371016 RepID=A0AA40HKD5_CNENI|nr:hypothetical protein QTO34_006340 [Eptesicus nilssonii]